MTDRVVARGSRTAARVVVNSGLTVHKFGGSTLADGSDILRAASLASARDGAPILAVTSALSGVTDALLRLVHGATEARFDVTAGVHELRERHLRVLHETVRGIAARLLLQVIEESFEELGKMLLDARARGSMSTGEEVRVLARGERLTGHLMAAALEAAGVSSIFVDATQVIVLRRHKTVLVPDEEATRNRARAVIRPLLGAGIVPVVPGFFGADPRGELATLGRGGSDLTATLLGGALGARIVVLWKDVPGLLTADPRVVSNARLVDRMHPAEAAELARLGARVLHPRALDVLGDRTSVSIRAFRSFDSRGTTVSPERACSQARVRAVGTTTDQILLTLHAARPPFDLTARAWEALSHSAIRDWTITSRDGGRVALMISPATCAAEVMRALRTGFAAAIAGGSVELRLQARVATVGVVGLDVSADPFVAARLGASLAAAGIPVHTTVRSSEHSVAAVIDESNAAEAQRVVHEAFNLHGQAVAT